MSFALSNGTNSLGKSVQSDVIAARNIRTDALTTNRLTVTGGAISIQEEGVDVLSSSTLNFVGSSVAASDVGGVATVTISASASSLASVLAAGNDATGLDVTNLGSLTFDTAGPQGINIGTDVAGATTSMANQIAIGSGASLQAASGGSIVIGDAASDTSFNYFAFGVMNNICIGKDATVSSVGRYSISIGNNSDTQQPNSIAIGHGVSALHIGSIVIGSALSSTASGELTVGTNAFNMRIPFTIDATVPTAGTIALPAATTMMNITINDVAYQIPLFAP